MQWLVESDWGECRIFETEQCSAACEQSNATTTTTTTIDNVHARMCMSMSMSTWRRGGFGVCVCVCVLLESHVQLFLRGCVARDIAHIIGETKTEFGPSAQQTHGHFTRLSVAIDAWIPGYIENTNDKLRID